MRVRCSLSVLWKLRAVVFTDVIFHFLILRRMKRAPNPHPILIPSNFVPQKGFPAVKGLSSPHLHVISYPSCVNLQLSCDRLLNTYISHGCSQGEHNRHIIHGRFFTACPRVVTLTALQTAGAFVCAHDYRAVRTVQHSRQQARSSVLTITVRFVRCRQPNRCCSL